MKPLIRNYSPVATIFVAFALVGAQSAHAVNAAWNTDAATGDFGSPNWTSGTTTPAAGGTYTVVSNDALFFGTSTTTTLNNNLSGANFNGLTFNSGASAFTIGGNSFTLNGNITNNSSSLQTINNAMTFGARTFSGGAGGLALGGTLTSTGSITVNSGAVALNGAATIDGGAGSNNGFLTVAGNTSLTINSGGSLTVLGTTNATKPGSIIGQNAAGTSTLTVNGGSFTVGGNTAFALGNNVNTATGVMTVSSGTATITAGSAVLQNQLNYIALGRDNATGILNLNGGTLETGRQFVRDGSGGGTVGSGTANFNFNGGTLKALANQTSGNGWFETATTGNFQVVTTTVKAGGAKIDTNGFNTNINTALVHDSALGATLDGGLAKSGLGTLTLGGASTFTGAANINAGTLALASTGSLTTNQISVANGATFDVSAVSGGYSVGSGKTVTNNGTVNGSFTVASGGTLNGTGTVTGNLTVASGGNVAPGNSPGVVTVNGNFDLQSGSTLNVELDGTSPGTEYDQLFVNGSVTLAGALNLTANFAPVDGDLFFILVNDGADAINGTFAGLLEGGTFNVSGQEYQITYQANFEDTPSLTGGNDVALVVVPEPAAALLGGLGLLGLLRRRRVA
jgi:fibronectin-binding autotransporter adhesin